MVDVWVWAALAAMLANVAKVMLVKTHCRELDSWWLVFFSRLLPGLALLLVLQFVDYQITDAMAFWGATLAAAIITIGASLLYMNAVKQGALSVVTPIQATIPMFMIACTWVLYDEVPGWDALLFMLMIIASVSFVLYSVGRGRARHTSTDSAQAVLWSLIAAALFGVSTVLDRVAIAATTHGALVFSAYWNLITLLLLLPVLGFRRRHFNFSSMRLSMLAFYVMVVFVAFLAQQYAVQWSLSLENGVTFVKTIVMGHIVLATLLGMVMLRERVGLPVLLASGVSGIGGVGLLWII